MTALTRAALPPIRSLAGTALLVLALLPLTASAAGDNAVSRIVEGAGGVPLVVQEWGNPEGTPVLLIHGFSFGAVAFKNQIGPIAEKLRFVAPDLRGHGLSAKPWEGEAYEGTEVWAEDIARVIEAYDLERPVILGWSFGGYVAANYLRHCGAECASGLILVGSLAGLVPQPPPTDRPDYGMPPPKGNVRADNYHELFEGAEWIARVMSYEAPTAAVAKQKEMNIVMMPPMVRRAMAGLALDNQDLPGELKLPVLMMHGDKDGSVPPASIAAAVAALPDARAMAFENVGHSPFAERPEAFNAALLEFAQETWSAAPGD
jgi:non-heme chloroperoxidase